MSPERRNASPSYAKIAAVILVVVLLLVTGVYALVARGRALLAVPVAVLSALLVFLVATRPIAQKVLGHLAMPAGLVFLALFLAGVVAFDRRYRGWAAVFFALFVGHGLSGNAYLGGWLISRLQRDVEPVDWRNGPAFDAVLVLGGGTGAGRLPGTHQLSAAGDRVMLGARIYHARKTRWLVASGHSIAGLEPIDLSEATRAIWTEIGVPADRILRLREPTITREEIEAFDRLVSERRFSRVAILSSSYHLSRAMRHAERIGLVASPIAADHRRWPQTFTDIDLVPHRTGFLTVQTACWEMVGRLVGR